ncbi:MAG: hypothetical protein KKD75_04545 [Nanoarchaeota archaeon]|nr:hypothetical protein [Nanoarchaeota archaeon]
MNITEQFIALNTVTSSIWYLIKYPLYLLLAYLGSQILEFVLDKYIKKLRIDKWLLYLLLVKTPYAKTKVLLNTKSRPDFNLIRKEIETKFEEGLDLNDLKGNSYMFKVRNHPTPIKISYVEPSEDGRFAVVMETFGDDKINKIFPGSMGKTIEILESVSDSLKQLALQSITATIKLNYVISDNSNINYQFKKDINLSTNSIVTSTKHYTKLTPLIKEALREWRVTFL